MNFNSVKSPKVLSNESGLTPLGFKVLIKMDKLEEKTKGGLYLPADAKAKEEGGSQSGRLVAVGPAAFSIGDIDLEHLWNTFPEIGDRVLINKYGGIQVDGKDGYKYRFLHDNEILAIINEENNNE